MITNGLSGGYEWSPTGVGDGQTSVAQESATNTFTIAESVETVHFWLAGMFGFPAASISSAYVTQGTKSTPITVNGQTSFMVPSMGRWSDNVSIADFTTPGEVSVVVNYAIPTKAPTFSDDPVPDNPVAISAINPSPELPASVLFCDEFDLFNAVRWAVSGSGTRSYSVADGKISFTVGDATHAGVITFTTTIPYIYPLPAKYAMEFSIQCHSLPPSAEMSRKYFWIRLTEAISSTLISIDEDGIYDYDARLCDSSTASIVFRVEVDGTKYRIFMNDILKAERETWDYERNNIAIAFGLYSGAANHVVSASVDYILIQDGLGEVYVDLTELIKSGDITINANPSPGETFTVSNSATTVFTFVDHYPLNATQIQIAATTALTAQALATAINDISGAEFVATVDGSVISVDAYCESAFAMTTTSTGIAISSITEIVPGLTTETITAADSFTATDGGKAVQENATAADSTDGLVDGPAESASVTTLIDCLNDEMTEGVGVTTTSDNFDGLIDYMGEEI